MNKKKLRLFGELGFGLGTIKYDADNANERNSDHAELSGGITVLNLGFGANYFFNDTFGLEVIVPYLNVKNVTSERADTIFSGVGPTFGVIFNLR